MRGRRTLILAVTFVLAIAITFLFAYRAGRHARMLHWQNEPIHGWMSINFIAHSHHVPAEVLFKAAGVEPLPKDHRPLRRLAHEQKRPVDQLIRDLNKAIAEYHAHPPAEKTP